jgi:hypothetical protein
MKRLAPSPVIALAVIGTQLLGPAVLWAADQRGVRIEATRRVVVSALSGDQLTLQNGGGTKTLQFREGVAAGDRLTTGDRTMAEVLLGTRAVVTVGQGTSVQFTTVTPEQTTIQVSKGTVRVAAAASALGEQGLVTVQTPTGQVQTRGGIVRVLVDAPVRAADQIPTGEARPYLASYSPTTLLAAVNTRGDVIQVEEGTAEVLGAVPGAKAVTVQAGQAVGVQAGQAGPIAGITTQDNLKSGVVATVGHRSTPKEGMDNLVALQMDQATQLGKALTGAAETGEGQSGSKDESGKAINGATGGVALTNAVSAALFGTNNSLLASTGGAALNRSGSATVDDSNDAPARPVLASDSVQVKGGAGLLLFTERNPIEAIFLGGDKTLDSNYRLNMKVPERSDFVATKELLLITGGDKSQAAHMGNAPISTLIARGISNSNELLPLSVAGSFGLPDSNGSIRPLDKRDILTAANARVMISKTVSDTRPVFNNSLDLATSVNLVPAALSDFTNLASGYVCFECSGQSGGQMTSFIDGAITARGATINGLTETITLAGGAVLDLGTKVSLGETEWTNGYFDPRTAKSGLSDQDAKFIGSLLTVRAGDGGGWDPAYVKIQDRILGVLNGSSISPSGAGNIALLSVLDSRLTGPDANDPSTGTALSETLGGRKNGEIVPLIEMDNGAVGTVTSAVVVRSTNVTLDGALLTASSPLLAMMNASMTTTSHFADLAGNNSRPALLASLVPGDALVRLNNNSILTVQGNLLNLNNATASVTGYLFSLNGGSTLNLNGGGLFSLTGGSALTLNGSAFGVFGSGANTLSITNGLCGGGAACGLLVNSSNTPFTINGTSIKVAGVSQNLVLPDSFKPFALAQNAPTPTVTLSANAALFKVDGTSTLTINATKVR